MRAKIGICFSALLLVYLLAATSCTIKNKNTIVSIHGEEFYINDELTYKNRYWDSIKIEGLLLNSRMVQGIFDDLNPDTRHKFIYPDTKTWDADRNTREFISAMNQWYNAGLIAFTLNMQGGSPSGYGNFGTINSAFDPKGNLRPDYMKRLELILKKADEMGMVVILGYFYFGQDEHLEDEKAIIHAVDNITHWIIDNGYRNILVEINNECDNVDYNHKILQPERVIELIDRVKQISESRNFPLLVSTSFCGGKIPTSDVVKRSDYILLHGNGVEHSSKLNGLINETRKLTGYRSQPIVINEDDHFNFESNTCNFVTSIKNYCSWGYFDFRYKDEKFEDGYQSMPVDWGINSDRKRSFFQKLREITGR